MNAGTRTRTTSIGRRLVGGLALFSLLVSVLATGLQVAYDYHHRVGLLKQDIDAQVDAIGGSLAGAARNVDDNNAQLLLEGLQRTPGVALVRLDTLDNQQRTMGTAPAQVLDVRRYPLRLESGDRRSVGALVVTLADDSIRSQVESRARAIALVTLAVVGSGCLVVFLLFRHLLLRHLERIAEYACTLDLEHLDRPLLLDRPPHAGRDELDFVVSGFDRMRERMAGELALRQRHEAELEGQRRRLSNLVEERTQALSQRNLDLELARADAEHLANTDHLTGLGNRRHFYALAESMLVRGKLGAVMVDVDHFKQVNDRHGHASGDRVLAEVATRLRDAIPANALVGRLGGEEFAALLPGMDPSSLMAVAERLRQRVAGTTVAIGDAPPLACTVSVGIAMSAPGLGIDQLLARADDALYRAKQSGRNRVVAWDPSGPHFAHGSSVRRRDERG